jgi:hypothetical protein
MNKSRDLILTALEYYDKNKEKYGKYISKIKYYDTIINENDMEHSVIIFYDKNKKELFRSRYEIIGIYYNYSSTWVWSWTIPDYPKNATFITKKILNYGLDIDNKQDPLLKIELITSRFTIFNKIQLDIHIAISSYIAKVPFIINIYFNPKLQTDGTYKNFNSIDELYGDENDFHIMSSLFILDDI